MLEMQVESATHPCKIVEALDTAASHRKNAVCYTKDGSGNFKVRNDTGSGHFRLDSPAVSIYTYSG